MTATSFCTAFAPLDEAMAEAAMLVSKFMEVHRLRPQDCSASHTPVIDFGKYRVTVLLVHPAIPILTTR